MTGSQRINGSLYEMDRFINESSSGQMIRQRTLSIRKVRANICVVIIAILFVCLFQKYRYDTT